MALEEFRVNQCGYLWLCTTVSMVTNITNCWRLFRYGVKIDHYKKMIDIREFSEQIAQDFFNNPISPDIGTPVKKINPP